MLEVMKLDGVREEDAEDELDGDEWFPEWNNWKGKKLCWF